MDSFKRSPIVSNFGPGDVEDRKNQRLATG